MKPISSNLHFYLLSIPMMVLFSISFFTARAQVTENNPMKQTKTFYFNGIPVPQGIMDSLPAKPEDRAVADFPETNKAAAGGNEAPVPALNKLGQTVIGEPFCDVRFEGDSVIFRNPTFVEKDTKTIVDVPNETEVSFQEEATIIYVKETKSVFVHNGWLIVHLRFQENPTANQVYDVILESLTEARKTPFERNAIISKDGSLAIFLQQDLTTICETGKSGKGTVHELDGKIFTHPGAIYDNPEEGIFVATTPTELIVKINDKYYRINYNKRWGDGPALVKPTIKLVINDIEITDPTMPGQHILIDSKTGANGLLDMPSQPNRTIDMK